MIRTYKMEGMSLSPSKYEKVIYILQNQREYSWVYIFSKVVISILRCTSIYSMNFSCSSSLSWAQSSSLFSFFSYSSWDCSEQHRGHRIINHTEQAALGWIWSMCCVISHSFSLLPTRAHPPVAGALPWILLGMCSTAPYPRHTTAVIDVVQTANKQWLQPIMYNYVWVYRLGERCFWFWLGSPLPVCLL